MKRLVLIDGHSVLYRSFFAFIRNPLRNSRGENTSAPFGFANTIRKVIKELKPDLCAVVFDAPGKTFREELFTEYKAQRPKVPDELKASIPVVKEMVQAWGVKVFEVPGVEADDVIGTIAEQGKEQEIEVVVVSSDKDLLQLVDERVKVYDPWKEQFLTPAEVKEKLGVSPEQVPEFLALAGDTVDNIPGVPGVGPKRALDILLKYGGLDEALQRDERLKSYQDVVKTSKQLAVIRCDAPVEFNWEDLKLKEMDREKLVEIYRRLEFNSLLQELTGNEVSGNGEFEGLKVVEFGTEPLAQILTNRVCGLFFERDKGVWVYGPDRTALCVPIQEPEALVRLGSARDVVFAGFELKGMVKEIMKMGIEELGAFFDVGVGAWLLDPNRKRFEVSDVSAQILGQPIRADSGAEKAALAYKIYQALLPQIQAMGLEPVARELEMPLIFVLARMERRGVKIDINFLARLEQELVEEQKMVERRIHDLAGVVFNVGSPKQLGQVLFERLKLPRGRRTKTGYSTGSDVLTELVEAHPIVKEVLRYRELDKLISTYLNPLRGLAEKKTQRVYTNFNQTGTSTGRLSSSEPNLQNIPIRGELGRKVRRAFVADEGMVLISADYSQIELRILAHFTEDERLIELFEQDEDIHVATAAAILNIPIEAVTEEHRRIAKMVNYGIIYGMGDWGLSSRMDIPVEQARAFIEEYYRKFPGVAKWRERAFDEAQRQGFVRTIAGRIRPVPGVMSPDRQTAEAAQRAALNAPMQGSAADIMKKAMIAIDRRMREMGFEGGIILQIHDELVVEVEEARLDEAREIVKMEMEGAWRLRVPLVVEIGVGRNWGEAH
ncbi:DNA polymerase I [candidate division WOR-3 bacterium]|nr:DNA polymerase I [candidate division WOR-3 bacterium]